MPLPPLLSLTSGWRSTTPCTPILGWAIAHPGSTSCLNPSRVRSNGVNSRPGALRERGTVSATELADEGTKRKRVATHDRATRREFVSKFHNLLQHMGRRGQLDKVGQGRGARWKLAPQERDLI
jgi:hypothetical protein